MSHTPVELQYTHLHYMEKYMGMQRVCSSEVGDSDEDVGG